jgi:uncharacterized protein (UPF0333 family)
MNEKAQISLEILVSIMLLMAIFAIAVLDYVLKTNATNSIDIGLGIDNSCIKLSAVVSKIALNQGMSTSLWLGEDAMVSSSQVISVQDKNQLSICSYLGRASDANVSKGTILIKNVSGVVGFA